jgi:hypothetical protein
VWRHGSEGVRRSGAEAAEPRRAAGAAAARLAGAPARRANDLLRGLGVATRYERLGTAAAVDDHPSGLGGEAETCGRSRPDAAVW